MGLAQWGSIKPVFPIKQTHNDVHTSYNCTPTTHKILNTIYSGTVTVVHVQAIMKDSATVEWISFCVMLYVPAPAVIDSFLPLILWFVFGCHCMRFQKRSIFGRQHERRVDRVDRCSLVCFVTLLELVYLQIQVLSTHPPGTFGF